MPMQRYVSSIALLMLVATASILVACNSSSSGSGTEQSDASPYSSACSISFDTYGKGVESGFLIDEYALDEPGLFVIRTREELERFWTKHAAIFFPQPPLPEIDFSQDMLIAVVDTVEPSGGYALCIEALTAAGGEVSVEVRKIRPGPDDIVTDSLTVPYHIITLAKSDMPFVLKIRG